ncbi:MAG: ABC transporter permease subunit [Chitinivibrionales bacterium]|nr:ABC transporter permease subunit [Chitinivibrionales bacterium]
MLNPLCQAQGRACRTATDLCLSQRHSVRRLKAFDSHHDHGATYVYLTFIAKELLRNILSLRYSLVFFLFVLLIVAATVVRTEMYHKQVADYTVAQRGRSEAMHSAERFWQSRGLGITVDKPPNPLGIFAVGLENEITRSFSLSEWALPRTGERKLSNPSFRYGLNLDMVMIMNLVCSLLAMLLVFDAVSGEREQGTLRVLLAGPLPRDVVILSKLVAGLLTLLIPLAIAWMLSLLYVLVLRRVQLDGEQMVRLAWIAGLSVVYVTFFFGVGMAVTAWTRRSATSLAISLFVWIVFVLAVPNLVPMVVDRFAPIPPESKITLEKEAFGDEFDKEMHSKVYAELSASGKYDENESELWQELQRRKQEYIQRESEKLDRFYNSRIARQLRLNQEMSRLSPSASFVYTATHMASTGVRDFLRIIDEVDEFAREYKEVEKEQEEKRRKEQENKQIKWFDVINDAYDPALWPPFEPKVEQLASVVNRGWLDMGLLFGGTVVFFLLAVVGFMRYDPR